MIIFSGCDLVEEIIQSSFRVRANHKIHSGSELAQKIHSVSELVRGSIHGLS